MGELAIAGHARALLEWHNTAKFCGACGAKAVPTEAGRRRQCSNESCKKRIYPRDPVVIMLVIGKENDRVLLSRQSRFVPRMWSCLAGFIEDGKATEELHQIQNGKATEELHEIQEEDEIVMDESVCFSMQSAGQICINDGGPVEKFDQNSSRKSAEIIADDTDSGDVKKVDQNSSKSDIEDEITPNATEGVENSDQCTLTMSSPEIAHEERNEHHDAAQETASTQTIPTTQMMAHEPQIFEEAKADTVTETAQAEVAEATTMEKNVFEQEEQKPLAEPVEIATSPVNSSMSSLLKPTEKKGPANPGWNERGMKLEQDCISGELSKGGATKGVAVVTMDRRAAFMAILALIFAVTIGVNIVLRLYYPLQAT